jgi:hypothetical protein
MQLEPILASIAGLFFVIGIAIWIRDRRKPRSRRNVGYDSGPSDSGVYYGFGSSGDVGRQTHHHHRGEGTTDPKQDNSPDTSSSSDGGGSGSGGGGDGGGGSD